MTLASLTEAHLQEALASARDEMRRVDEATPEMIRTHGTLLLERYEAAIATIRDARAELASRAGQKTKLRWLALRGSVSPTAQALEWAALHLGV